MTETVDEIPYDEKLAKVILANATTHSVRQFLIALRKAGYAIVPVEPTDAMIEAGVSADFGKTLGDRVRNCHRAMLMESISPSYSEQRLDFYRVRDAFSPGYTERRAGLKAGKEPE